MTGNNDEEEVSGEMPEDVERMLDIVIDVMGQWVDHVRSTEGRNVKIICRGSDA